MEQGIKYRARFLTRPDLDSDDWTDHLGGVVIGREYTHPDGSTWCIAEIQQDETNIETIVFAPVC